MRIALSLALVLVAAPASAAGADPATGEHIAKTECATCHAIARDAEAKSPDPKAPRFVDVAKMASTTELSLKVFLRSSHRNMPNFILSREEIDSLASYILELGGK
ncbi:cytochrome c [Methylocystis sp. B8]|uniref:c-type cytochrome n=1 Tax=Methylocystis sp. B8 TaxID=544938 RepID=UPI0010FD93AA|nr:cytochrome c [Methylocystis sp. B8]TLG75637.1 cytochrome c [Methylocystis sp. B8]